MSKHGETVSIQVSTDKNNIFIAVDCAINVEFNRHEKRQIGTQCQAVQGTSTATQTEEITFTVDAASDSDGPETGLIDVESLIGAWESFNAEAVDCFTEATTVVTDATTDINDAVILDVAACDNQCCVGKGCRARDRMKRVRTYSEHEASGMFHTIMGEHGIVSQDKSSEWGAGFSSSDEQGSTNIRLRGKSMGMSMSKSNAADSMTSSVTHVLPAGPGGVATLGAQVVPAEISSATPGGVATFGAQERLAVISRHTHTHLGNDGEVFRSVDGDFQKSENASSGCRQADQEVIDCDMEDCFVRADVAESPGFRPIGTPLWGSHAIAAFGHGDGCIREEPNAKKTDQAIGKESREQDAMFDFARLEEAERFEEESAYDLWELEDVIAKGYYKIFRAMDGWQRYYEHDNVTMGNCSIYDIFESCANIDGWCKFA